MAIRALKSSRVIDGYRSIPNGVVVFTDGIITAIGPQSTVEIPPDAQVTDYGDLIISPGFIDTHLHGFKGIRAESSMQNNLDLAAFVAQNGTTTILPTTTVPAPESVGYVYEAMQVQEKEGYKGARIAGAHMEGPFWSPKNLPGRPEVDAGIVPPSIALFDQFWEAAHGHILQCDVGIDQPTAFETARYMHKKGVLVGSAHTKIGYEGAIAAIENNVTHAVHLYNVMTGLHHRRPGVVGAYLTTDQTTAELICDGLHVAFAAMDIAIRCKGYDRICIITDLSMAGLPDGDYERADGRWLTVKDGISRMKGSDPSQDNTMSGSCITQDVGVKNVHQVLGHPLEAAIRMASISPAKMVKIDSYTGSLEVGKSADIAIFDNDIKCKETIVAGTTVYKA
ncbi:N-acetylglucosamine-6-phosphate deacetylase [Eubacteriales bacterium OttesenSCG-928-M02]|nr:N-acetylglucosamine-6-phosphate deacetylase [Eubacteriales bacterium OttesenSCG-928-M02]